MTTPRNLPTLLAAAAFSVAVMTAPARAAAEPATTAPIVLERDGIRVTVGPPEWTSIVVDGIPFSSIASLWVVNPNWIDRYYGYVDDATILTSATRIGTPPTGLVSSLHGKKEGEFTGKQRIEILPGRTVRLAVEFRINKPVREAMVDTEFASILPAWFSGSPWEAKLAGGRVASGRLSPAGERRSLKEAAIAKDFRSVRLDTARGPVTIQGSGNLPPTFLDYRRNLWEDDKLFFLLGVFNHPIKGQTTYTLAFDITFPPPIARGTAATTASAGLCMEDSGVVAAYVPPDLVIPTPKQIRWDRGDWPLTGDTRLVAEGASEADRAAATEAAEAFAAAVKEKTGLGLALAKPGAPGRTLRFRIRPSGRTRIAGEYRLTIGDTARVEAATTEGLFAGEKTLRQLLRTGDGGPRLRRCTVSDWPSLPFRGIHFFTGAGGADIQTTMVRDILGALKINKLLYQCEFIKWECEPRLHHPTYGMAKADAVRVRDEARRQKIEIIPLINTFGHSEWIVERPAFRELADDPEKPYAFDPSNPKVYELCERVYAEAIELFRPRVFNIGHDEIVAPGFPKRPANRAKGIERLILDDIAYWHAYLGRRGIRTMMWGDMLLAPGESTDATNADSVEAARRMRAQLPRDIIITDWHYAPATPAEYRSLGILNDTGFDAVAAPWLTPHNIVAIARAAADRHARGAQSPGSGKGETLGTVQTTWAGYSFDPRSFAGERKQYAAYVLAAEAAWTGGATSLDDVPFNYYEEFTRLWGDSKLPDDARGGWFCDLAPAANATLADLGLRGADIGKTPRLGQLRVAAKPADAGRGVLLSGRIGGGEGRPGGLALKVGRRASSVVFAAVATQRATAAPIARTLVRYADGSETGFDWVPGVNAFTPDDIRVGPATPVIWKAARAGGKSPGMLRGFVWQNPRPEKLIREIEFLSTDGTSSLAVFGVCGLEERGRPSGISPR